MDTQRILERDTKYKRKSADGILDFIRDDFQSCKYLKVEAEKPQPVEKTCDLPGSEGQRGRVLAQQDALNFQKSGVPLCFMFYDKGEWRDYPRDVIPTILKNFVARKVLAKFSIRDKVYLVNFVYMIQLNLTTGYARSVAWIDKNGQRFTPSRCIEGSCAGSLSVLQHLAFEDSKVEAKWGNSLSFIPSSQVKTAAGTLEKSCNDFARLSDKLIKLAEDDQDFMFVKDKFLSGFSLFAKDATITNIHRNSHTSISGQARLQAFRIQEGITAEIRGDANVRYAWHGTSKEGVSSVILHGFGQPSVPKNGGAYGVGVYLAPEDSSHSSALYSNVDENGEQHLMLCQVIMGRMEQVHAGSQQFHPSNEDYDTGVDDAKSPKRYIIWNTHMNTHILPLFIVSFKLARLARDVMIACQRGKQALKECLTHVRRSTWDDQSVNDVRVSAESGAMCLIHPPDGQLKEAAQHALPAESCTSGVSVMCDIKPTRPCTSTTSNTCSKGRHRIVPRSPWIPFAELLPLLEAKLKPQAMIALQQLHVNFQVGKLPRNLFVKKVRGMLGDEFLRDCIKNRSVQAVSSCSTLSFCG